MPKIVMAVGGTGGHIYPAIALAHQLKGEIPGLEILFMGGKLNQNRYFDQGQFPFHTTPCASLSKNPLKLIKGGLDILRGIGEAGQWINHFDPDLTVGFGSYHSFPALAAAAWNKHPFILHESNSIPGKVNRLLASQAVMTGILFPSAANKLKGQTTLVDMPLREGYRYGSTPKTEALAYYGLENGPKTILIFGGSQGAQALNQMAADGLQGPFQVIHITGSNLHVEQIKEAYLKKGIKACVKEFENRMDYAWQAADMCLCRSGAGTLAEAIEFEVPTLMVPYPHAADNHQVGNALFMEQDVKGGKMSLEQSLDPFKLNNTVNALLEHELPSLTKNIQEYKRNQKRKSFSHLIAEHL